MSRDANFLLRVKAYIDNIPNQYIPTWHTHSRDVLKPLIATLEPGNHVARSALFRHMIDKESIDCFEVDESTARHLVDGANFLSVPIFTKTALFEGIDDGLDVSPISQLLSWFASDDQELHVQIASDHFANPETAVKTMGEIKQRFDDKRTKSDPWNILGAESPLADATLPAFLQGKNCSLLSTAARTSHSTGEGTVNTPGSASWSWRRQQAFILLAEAGALTTPHQDACGFGTWITCCQGEIGFAWLSRPTEVELDDWLNDPDHFEGGIWRFRVLTPKDTVYFDPGLVHFVFRASGEDNHTFAIGGHVLRFSAMASWMKVLAEQHRAVNEREGLVPLRTTPLPFNDDAAVVLDVSRALWNVANDLVHGPSNNAIRFFNDENELRELLEYLATADRRLKRSEALKLRHSAITPKIFQSRDTTLKDSVSIGDENRLQSIVRQSFLNIRYFSHAGPSSSRIGQPAASKTTLNDPITTIYDDDDYYGEYPESPDSDPPFISGRRRRRANTVKSKMAKKATGKDQTGRGKAPSLNTTKTQSAKSKKGTKSKTTGSSSRHSQHDDNDSDGLFVSADDESSTPSSNQEALPIQAAIGVAGQLVHADNAPDGDEEIDRRLQTQISFDLRKGRNVDYDDERDKYGVDKLV